MVVSPLPLLTIAGSDSGGAAGLQADLKTWAALGAHDLDGRGSDTFSRGVYGMSVVTAVTAQNSAVVRGVYSVPPDFVAAQVDTVLSDYGAAAIKTGFLGRVDIIAAVADRLAYWRGGRLEIRPILVVDPVLVNYRGEPLFGPEVATAYREHLLPLADLATPNAAEAALLGFGGDGVWQGAARILLKGWRRDADEITDLYWDGRRTVELSQLRIDTINTHGSGDTLSAAICAFRACDHDWLEAINLARAFTHAAIRRGAAWRLGAGHGPLGY